jgi:hypothetical protein
VAVDRAVCPHCFPFSLFFSYYTNQVKLISILESGRRDVVDAALEAAAGRPSSGWTAIECVEHVITVEERYLRWIADATEITPIRDPDKELRLFTMMRNRLDKVETPAVFLPQGRFKDLPSALAEFQATRDRSVQIVKDRGDSLYAVGSQHPYFGAVNGVELIQMIDAHARRHAEQIREL